MKENFLHFIWKNRLLENKGLQTTEGESLQIIHPGFHNHNAGPDFLNAKIKMGAATWSGHIEIHKQSSEYDQHGHQKDAAYKNVILHVVYNDDKPSSQSLPTLVLNGRIPFHLIRNYDTLLKSEAWIPCENIFHHYDMDLLPMQLIRLATERLQRKTGLVLQTLQQNKNNWEQTFYEYLAKAFGMKVNAEAFEMLAQSLPVIILAKHKTSFHQIEAIVFGQAGFLNEIMEDVYMTQLQKEYQFLQHKHQLQPLSISVWKFSRMRPQNFPSIRLSQFATMIYNSSHLFSKLLACDTWQEAAQMFDVSASNYWQTHYKANVISSQQTKKLGPTSIQSLLINAVIPCLFAYGVHRDDDALKQKALDWLEKMKAERNQIISGWQRLHVQANSSLDSMALIELKNEYCAHKNCLNCGIGIQLLNRQ